MSYKKYYLIGAVLVAAFFGLFQVQDVFMQEKIKPVGEIMYGNLTDEEGKITILDLPTGKKITKNEGGWDSIYINNGKGILFTEFRSVKNKISSDEFWITDVKTINLDTGVITNIATIPYEVNFPLLLPNKKICFIDAKHKVHVYDLEHRKDFIIEQLGELDDTCIQVSWNKNNNSLLASTGKTIYRYNLNTNKKEPIIKGSCPSISRDFKKMAFVTSDGKSRLALMDLATQKTSILEDTCDVGYIEWSPDGNFVAYIQAQKSMADNFWELKILDLKSGVSKRIDTFYALRRISWR